MAMPSREQWADVLVKLDRMLDPVYLRCDDYLVRAGLMRTGVNRLGIVVSVNGWEFKGGWLPLNGRDMSEEARRFWRPSKQKRVKAKELKLYERVWGKRECRKRGYYGHTIWPIPIWNRPRPLIAHLCKQNQSIEIIDYETYSAEVEALRSDDDG